MCDRMTENRKYERVLKTLCGLGFGLLFVACMFPYDIYCIITRTRSLYVRDLFFMHRFDSLGLSIGLMLCLGGLRIISKRRYDPNSQRVIPINRAEQQKLLKLKPWYLRTMPITFVLEGKSAVRHGLVAFFLGLIALVFGLYFWLGIFIPAVLKASG